MNIEQLSAQNPWWARKEAIEKDDKVVNVLKTGEKIIFDLPKENSVLIGPRQLGKTTALKYDIYKKIMKEGFDPTKILYYSFDTSRRFEEIADVINTFIVDDKERTLYLDEVSFVEGWQRAIKQFLDSSKITHATVYVTGSSSINLKKELMPGRKIKFLEFKPLSFRSFLLSFGSDGLKKTLASKIAKNFQESVKISDTLTPFFEEINKLFDIYMNTGGYPDVIFDYLANKHLTEKSFDAHWNAFISDISKDNKSAEIATAVVYGIVTSYSSKINLSHIARMQGIKSHVTVREYLETFEDLFISKSVFPVAEKKYVFRKERKVYFNDPFLYNLFASKLNIIDREKEPKIVEGIAYSHIYRMANKGKTISEPKTSVGFYSGKKEIDFISNGHAIEVKWREKAKAEFTNTNLKKILLTKNTLEHGKNLSIIPLPIFISTLPV